MFGYLTFHQARRNVSEIHWIYFRYIHLRKSWKKPFGKGRHALWKVTKQLLIHYVPVLTFHLVAVKGFLLCEVCHYHYHSTAGYDVPRCWTKFSPTPFRSRWMPYFVTLWLRLSPPSTLIGPAVLRSPLKSEGRTCGGSILLCHSNTSTATPLWKNFTLCTPVFKTHRTHMAVHRTPSQYNNQQFEPFF